MHRQDEFVLRNELGEGTDLVESSFPSCGNLLELPARGRFKISISVFHCLDRKRIDK